MSTSQHTVLAYRVADAASAWLTDPRDTQVYVRLVQAVDAWRAHTTPTLDTSQSFTPVETVGEFLGSTDVKTMLKTLATDPDVT